jgi:hypothetical protein
LNRKPEEGVVGKFFRNNGLSLVLFSLFLIFLVGQVLTGMVEYNDEQQEHGGDPAGLVQYLGTGHFWEALTENWESEFLQMAAYVVFTIFLYQKGSSESKDPDAFMAPQEIDPHKDRDMPGAPGPVKRGGWVLRLYENSLSIALILLFLGSFAFHAVGGAKEYSSDQLAHGGQPVTAIEYLGTSRFWFESFQNWQSEFMSIGVLVVLTIFLRQRGSPESKKVSEPHFETGG